MSVLVSSASLLPVTAAAAVFLGLHLLSSSPLRGRVAGAIGEGRWLGLFSLLSAAALAWLIWAWSAAPHVEIWPQTLWARHLPLVFMPFSFVLVVLAYTTPNPTAVGMDVKVLMGVEDPARGVFRITRHPLMWGITLWAASHIPANGDAASLAFFGSLGLLALLGMPAIDRKMAAKHGERWDRFAAHTSILPFAAIAQGRTKLSLGEIGWWRIALGLALYVAFLFVHDSVIGTSPWPAG